tara:strand:- start:210 stop:590 length:381 start_codon:yes stop_codon:yes gene_type:complete
MTDSKISDLTSVVSSEDHEDISEDDIIIPTTVKYMDIISVQKSYSEYTTKHKKTQPYINKYERAKILGIRAQQLANGMQPLVSTEGKKNIYEVVEAEYREGVIPLIIRRYLPDNTHEDWKISDLFR